MYNTNTLTKGSSYIIEQEGLKLQAYAIKFIFTEQKRFLKVIIDLKTEKKN